MQPAPRDATVVLSDVVRGSASAAAELAPLVYDELKKLAARYLRRERAGHTLQTTAVVHEAYLRLVNQKNVSLDGRVHFMAVAANVIRRVLVDHARHRGRRKREGGWQRLTISLAEPVAADTTPLDALIVSEVLDQLAGVDARQARVVELRVFAGLTIQETARLLELSPRTVSNEWRSARAWMLCKLSDEPA